MVGFYLYYYFLYRIPSTLLSGLLSCPNGTLLIFFQLKLTSSSLFITRGWRDYKVANGDFLEIWCTWCVVIAGGWGWKQSKQKLERACVSRGWWPECTLSRCNLGNQHMLTGLDTKRMFASHTWLLHFNKTADTPVWPDKAPQTAVCPYLVPNKHANKVEF